MGTGAIVLGGSGSVGQALLRELQNHPSVDEIIVLARRPLGLKPNTKLREFVVPVMSQEAVRSAVVQALREHQGSCIGYSTLGVGANTAKLTLEEHRAIDVGLNAAFAKGLCESGKVQQLAFMSAVGADINAKTGGSGAAGMPRYARVKGEAEAAVAQQGPEFVSIFRPSVIVGSEHTPNWLALGLKLVGPLLPQKYRPISTAQIAAAMVVATTQRPPKAAIYEYAQMVALAGGSGR